MQTIVQLYHAVDRSRFALAPPDDSSYHGTARAEHRRCGAVTTLNIENENGYHFHARYKHVGINTVPASRSLRSLVLLQCVNGGQKKKCPLLIENRASNKFCYCRNPFQRKGSGGIANDSQ